jgi:hypothetical protein
VEVTDGEWNEGIKRTVALLEKELEMCDEMSNSIKNTVGKKKLKGAISYILDKEKEENDRQEKRDEGNHEEEEVVKSFYNPKLLEKAKDAIYLRDRAIILKYRIAALKSRQCKSSENKQYCPEVFLNVIAEKLTYTVKFQNKFFLIQIINSF